MKSHKLFINVILAMLLRFNWLMARADKKTAIIAGSAGGGAATVIGGALWYKFRNIKMRLNFEVNDGKLTNAKAALEEFKNELAIKGFSSSVIRKIISDIKKDITKFVHKGMNSEFKYLIIKNKGRVTMEATIEKNGKSTNKLTAYSEDSPLLNSYNNNPEENFLNTEIIDDVYNNSLSTSDDLSSDTTEINDLKNTIIDA